jgi:hypothetical protein
MEEFLRYSMAHGKRIRAILMIDGRMAQQNIAVIRFTDEDFTFTSSKQRTPLTLPRSCLLSAGYARGDAGEGE